MIKDRITMEYLHKLQAVYHQIDRRGIVVDRARLAAASKYIDREILEQCKIVSLHWGVYCYIGASNKPSKDSSLLLTSVNLNSSSGEATPLAHLKKMGFVIPKTSARDEDGNYISKESLAELTLQKIYATNQFQTTGGDPAIRALLRIRELGTLRARYINANLYRQGEFEVFLSNYNCAGTVTGRRGSRKHSFGYGGNAQNFPKHGELAKIYRRCLVARPGKIFLMVDQMQAEDWPTSALADNTDALLDLESGADRHKKLAMAIFNLHEDHYTESGWKESTERYLGKKFRHANNYGMGKNTASDSLAKEGFSVTPTQCQAILDQVNRIDPSVDQVFHKYIKECLYADRKLSTPFGRERIFFGLRAGDSGGNNKIFNEAFSYIPQSTVGDNTGFAVYHLETCNDAERGKVLQESHDSITSEIDDSPGIIWARVQETIRATDRQIRFHNGREINIPWEAELAYDFHHTVTLKSASTKTKKLTDLTYQDIQASWLKLREYREKELEDAAKEAQSELD